MMTARLFMLSLLAASCGAPSVDSQLRITQPHAASVEEAELGRYVVDLRNNGKFFCTGVLLSPSKVLTAAHCFVREKNLNDLRARILGQDYPVLARQTLADQGGKVSEDYFPNFDLAILDIERVAQPTWGFPQLMRAEDIRASQGAKALIAGYGVTSTNVVDLGELRYGWTQVKRVATAGRYAGTLIVDSKAPSGPCMGDSGGPLFIKKSENWQIAGIVHGVNWYTNPAFFGEDPCTFDEATYVIPEQYIEHDTLQFKAMPTQEHKSWVEFCEKGSLDRDDLLPMKMIALKHRFKSCQDIYNALAAQPMALDFGNSLLISSRVLSLLPGLTELKADLSALRVMTRPLPEIQRMSLVVDQQKQLDYVLKVPGVKTLELRQQIPHILNYELLSNQENLVDLRLNRLDIAQLPSLSKLAHLEHLELSLNRLQNLDFLDGLVSLNYFNGSSNQISDISGLSRSYGLKTLVLSNNQIADIHPLKALPALERISLVNNRIQDKICPQSEEQEGDVCAF